MDMEEVLPEGELPDDRMLQQRRIRFTLVDSAMFADFSGEWRLQCYSRMPTGCADGDWTYSTKLFYMVNVKCVISTRMKHPPVVAAPLDPSH